MHLKHVSPASWTTDPNMVRIGRLELPTSRLSGVRSNLLSYTRLSGAGSQVRTGDLRITNALLYLLSYASENAVSS